jgi:hypothetical protein
VPLSEGLRCRCITANNAEFEPFSEGKLTLKGSLVRFDLLYRARPAAQEIVLPTNVDVFGYIPYKPDTGDRPIWLKPDVTDLASVQGEKVDLENGQTWKKLATVYAVPLASMNLPDGDIRTYSMVLRDKTDHGKGGEGEVFERIGLGFQSYLPS